MAQNNAIHELNMRHAIFLTRQNPKKPYAAAIVDREGEIMAEGINRSAENPLLHAEIEALHECLANHPSAKRTNLTLYTTAEPCPMCMSAILWAGLGAVVFGTSITSLKTLGHKQIEVSAEQIISASWNRSLELVGGILEDECDSLFLAAKRG